MRLRLQRFRNETIDLIDQRAAAGCTHAQRQRAGNVDTARISDRAGARVPIGGLAGNKALVDLRGAADHNSIRWYAFARPHQHAVAGGQGCGWYPRQFAVLLESVRELGFQAGEIAGQQPGLPPHGQIEITAAEQEEQQHDCGIEIGVGGVVCGLVKRQTERQHDADGDRHIHIECPRPQAADGALKERLSGIGGRRQRNQRGQPMKHVTRFLRHVGGVARPYGDRQQHDVHRGETRKRETLQEPSRLRRIVSLNALRREWVGAKTDPFQRFHDAGGVDLVVSPIHCEAALGKVQSRVDHARQLDQAAFDLADAAGAGNALHSQRHV